MEVHRYYENISVKTNGWTSVKNGSGAIISNHNMGDFCAGDKVSVGYFIGQDDGVLAKTISKVEEKYDDYF